MSWSDQAHLIFTTMSTPSRSMNLIRAMRQGLYADFWVCIGEKEYPLHQALIRDHSGYFNAMLQVTPNQTRVEFEADHLLSDLVQVWEHLVATWYQDPDYQPVAHHAWDHQDILSKYHLVCDYLSAKIPKLSFQRYVFLPYRINVCYYDHSNSVRIETRGYDSWLGKYEKVALGTKTGDPPSKGQLKPNQQVQTLIDDLNRFITEYTEGRCVGVITELLICRKKEDLRGIPSKLSVRVNGRLWRMWGTGRASSVDLTEVINDLLFDAILNGNDSSR